MESLFNKQRNYSSWFSKIRLSLNRSLPTITAHSFGDLTLQDDPYLIDDNSLKIGGTYPIDYNFLNNKAGYLIGMSVPPVMTAQIASNIYEQWISKLTI